MDDQDSQQADGAPLETLDLSAWRFLGLDLETWVDLISGGLGILTIVFGVFLWMSAPFRDWVKKLFSKKREAHSDAPPPNVPEARAPQTLYPVQAGIVGRGDDIKKIHNKFEEGAKAVALTGPGGIGKTKLATVYADALKGKRHDEWVLARVTDLSAMKEGFLTRAGVLGLDRNARPEALVQAAFDAINKGDTRWLVILDNADEEAARKLALDHFYDCAKIDYLITSQYRGWDERAEELPVGRLGEDEAVKLLAQKSERKETDDLRRLADGTLNGSPLALTIAGASLKSAGMTVADYEADLVRRLADKPDGNEYDKSVYVAIIQAAEELGEGAQAFLKLAAFMSPDDADPGFLIEGASYVDAQNLRPLPAPYAELVTHPTDVDTAARQIFERSLFDRGEWEGAETYTIHRTTQKVLRHWMGEEACANVAGVVGVLGDAQFTSNPQFAVQDWPRCRRLAPHALALLDSGATPSDGHLAPFARFTHHTAMFVRFAAGDLRLTLRLFGANLATYQTACGEDSEEYASALGNLANTQDQVARQAEGAEARDLERAAEANFKKVLDIPQSDLQRAYDLNNFAGFYWARKRFSEAEPLYQETLRLRVENDAPKELIGSAHSNLGTLYSDWADAVDDAGERAAYRDKARDYMLKGLEFTRAALGELHAHTALTLHNLSVEYYELGQFEKALEYSVPAAAIPLAMLRLNLINDPEHPEIVKNLNSLATVLIALGREPEAAVKEARDLAEAEIPNVLARHKEWQDAQSAEPADAESS